MKQLTNFGFYVYQILILLAVLFYIILKGAAGHGFIWYWYELGSFVLAVGSILFGYLSRSGGSPFVDYVALILFLVVFALSIGITVYVLSFDYDKDINAIPLYLSTILFTACCALNVRGAIKRTAH